MRLSFHHRDDGRELGAIETINGVATPTNDWAERRMNIDLGSKHRGKGPEHGDHYLQALADHYKRSSGVGVKLRGTLAPPTAKVATAAPEAPIEPVIGDSHRGGRSGAR